MYKKKYELVRIDEMKRILSDIDMKDMIYSPHHAHTVSKFLILLMDF